MAHPEYEIHSHLRSLRHCALAAVCKRDGGCDSGHALSSKCLDMADATPLGRSTTKRSTRTARIHGILCPRPTLPGGREAVYRRMGWILTNGAVCAVHEAEHRSKLAQVGWRHAWLIHGAPPSWEADKRCV
ncbi:hypothetical protein HPB47_027260 [Ixodes persulcatus]|uniref:Uncharacterized protein n=1 Tax=Ixodes persulcatus TaxID=34615 RepID=A0AC60PY06_IXOPE|nr:hypothetical protein HPB47_027260 [Ixodes persulcatus]